MASNKRYKTVPFLLITIDYEQNDSLLRGETLNYKMVTTDDF